MWPRWFGSVSLTATHSETLWLFGPRTGAQRRTCLFLQTSRLSVWDSRSCGGQARSLDHGRSLQQLTRDAKQQRANWSRQRTAPVCMALSAARRAEQRCDSSRGSLSFKAPGTFNSTGFRELPHPDFWLGKKQATTRKIERNVSEYLLCLQLHLLALPHYTASRGRFGFLLSSQIADIQEVQQGKGAWSLNCTVQEVPRLLVFNSTPCPG